MEEVAFFNAIEAHHKKQLPFVIYSKPFESTICGYLQKNKTLHTTTDFSESGFVFAPFDLSETSILFPLSECDVMTLERETLLVDESSEGDTTKKTEDKLAHVALVEKGISVIKKGELEKVVLSRCEIIKTRLEVLNVFKRLFNSYKNAMVYCWYHPAVGMWIGATPELLLNMKGYDYTTIALAGTKVYNENEQLQWTAKEIDEQQIVTDFITDQMKSFSKQQHVSEASTIRAGQLLHLKSVITGRLDVQAGTINDVIHAIHPTPAVCGFPKSTSKAFILEEEGYLREFYTGFFGELNLKTKVSRNTNKRNVENNAYQAIKSYTDLYVNLRCMQVFDDKVNLYVGGGITKDSNADNEWLETVSKTKTMLKVLF